MANWPKDDSRWTVGNRTVVALATSLAAATFLVIIGVLTTQASARTDSAEKASSKALSSRIEPQARREETLRSADTFRSIADRRERSLAIYAEASRVLLHPRCVNCHPSDDTPRQGDTLAVHEPPVSRGPSDHGVPAMQCSSCHQDRNLNHARVPGAPEWHLAPLKMAWLGRTAAQICAQIKDPSRNGNKTLEQLHEHMAADALVGWAWAPGSGRTPAPGTQQEFGALIRDWIDTGAECPTGEVSR